MMKYVIFITRHGKNTGFITSNDNGIRANGTIEEATRYDDVFNADLQIKLLKYDYPNSKTKSLHGTAYILGITE